MKRLGAVLFWSVIAAAFIGPGTVATAAASGARFGYRLLWALVFSTLACLVLQEAAARLKVVSGRSLGEALRDRSAAGWRRTATLLLIVGAIVVGCAAYEAGNILGGVAGARLGLALPKPVLTLLSGGLAAVLLWFNSPRRVAMLLSLLVAVMGLTFLSTAVMLGPSVPVLVRSALVPTLPPDSGLLAMALIGTTVVPYNLFLGSGIAGGQGLAEVRFGLGVAVVLGGVISMAVLVVGTAVSGEFDYDVLKAVLTQRAGPAAGWLFAAGLFAAGLSSAVTAPLAAAITARSLFAAPGSSHWDDRSWRYRAVWAGVLLVGIAFGLSGVEPIPVIVLAQALNGLLLPLAAIFLLLAVNDRALLGRAALNGPLSNALMAVVTTVALLLGVSGLARAGAAALGRPQPTGPALLAAAAVIALLIAYPVARAAARARKEPGGRSGR